MSVKEVVAVPPTPAPKPIGAAGETRPSTSKFDLMDIAGFGRVVSLSVVLGVVNVLLLTAMATLGAFLYNICASLVGGVQMTLTDD